MDKLKKKLIIYTIVWTCSIVLFIVGLIVYKFNSHVSSGIILVSIVVFIVSNRTCKKIEDKIETIQIIADGVKEGNKKDSN